MDPSLMPRIKSISHHKHGPIFTITDQGWEWKNRHGGLPCMYEVHTGNPATITFSQEYNDTDGRVHRGDDLPAYVWKTHQVWYVNGLFRHGPSAVDQYGAEWFTNGVLLRDPAKGPARVKLSDPKYYREWDHESLMEPPSYYF